MIPKIIHYCWFGGNEKPKLAKKCIKSWKKYCPDYEIKEWNETNIDFSIMPDYVREAYEAKKWGFVPDYIRLWIIYNYGGIYFDTDVEVIRKIDDLLKLKGFAGFELPNTVALGLGFGAEYDNKIIKELMDSYNGIHFINKDGSLNVKPAPQMNGEIFVKNGLICNGEKQIIGDITVFPQEYFCPMSYQTGKLVVTKNTYTIHHYMASWFTKEQKKAWEKEKRQRKFWWVDRLIHFPNIVLKKLMGEKKYTSLKQKIKKKGR